MSPGVSFMPGEGVRARLSVAGLNPPGSPSSDHHWGCFTKRSSLSFVFVPETSLCVAFPGHGQSILGRGWRDYRNSLVLLSENAGIPVGIFLQEIVPADRSDLPDPKRHDAHSTRDEDTVIALIQRVLRASVTIDDIETARIDAGLLALIGVERDDTAVAAERLAERILGYRIFADAAGRMNLDLVASGGDLLLVPQFTLAADTRSGRRPGFSSAAEPAQAEVLFDVLTARCRESLADARTGRFGAHMQIASVNDGPVTFHLRSGD